MIGPELVNRQPVSQLAASALRRFGVDAIPYPELYLVRLVLHWAINETEHARQTFPWSKYLPELTEKLYELQKNPASGWVASLFLPDRDQLNKDLEANKANPSQTWPILKTQLEAMASQLSAVENPNELANHLAENLYLNLHQANPDFGHPDPLLS